MNPSLLCIVSFALFGTLAAGAELPRYQLEVGQELKYSGRSEYSYTNGQRLTETQITLWVTRQNANGSWHLVGYAENSFQQVRPGEKDTPPPQKNEALGGFELYPDGRSANLPADLAARALVSVFPRLPADEAAAGQAWEVTPEADDTEIYRLLPPSAESPATRTIQKTSKGIFTDVYEVGQKTWLHYDTRRGLVSKIEMETSQGYGFRGKGTGQIELTSVTSKEAAWLTQLDREASTVDAASLAETKGERKLSGAERMEASRTALRQAREAAKLPLVQGVLDRRLAQVEEYAKYSLEQDEKEKSILGKAAAAWETTDLDGRKHALADYRGKVVLLDFWYRGCGWCVRAMPQIKEMVTLYEKQPVAILGMNTDQNEADAKFVVQKLGLNYPTLKAVGLPEKYGVQGFPTLVLIDQAGIVRSFHIGYSPKLRESVGKEIEDLLAKAAGQPAP